MIRLLRRYFPYNPGEVVTLSNEAEGILIKSGYAENVVPPKMTRKQPKRAKSNRATKAAVNRQLKTDESTTPEFDEARAKLLKK